MSGNLFSPYPPTFTPDPMAQMQSIQAQLSQMRGPSGHQSNVEKIKGGIESVKMYATLPNSQYVLFEEDDDVFWFKTTDASNYATIRRFRFYEEEENKSDSRYLTVEEFNKFKEEFLNGKQSVRECSDADDEPKHLK